MAAIVCWLLTLFWLILILRIVASWFPPPTGQLGRQAMSILWSLTEPVLAPLRGRFPAVRMGSMALDLSPIAVFIAIAILRRLLC